MTRSLSRRQALFAPLVVPALGALLLTACADDDTPELRTSFPPLDYSYLPVIHLSVATIDIENRATVVANDFSSQSPVLPTDALATMARQRLQASGNSGSASFVIDQASIVRTDNGLYGTFAVHVDVQSADRQKVASASATITRTYTGDIDDMRGTLYDMTNQMMKDMNVELEVQIRRTMPDWIQTVSTAPGVGSVQSQSLAPTTPTSAPVPLTP